MGRGVLPTYTRVCHAPNILEGYRYLSRINITVLASKLKMSYHTVRRVCSDSSKPQEKTIEKIQEALPFVTMASWDIWLDRCKQAVYAEQQSDIATLLEVEDALLGMLPETSVKKPLHFLPEASIETAKKLHEGSLVNKSASFYLSEVHVTAMDLLSINLGLTKSEVLRNMIDEYLLRSPEVAESLIQVVTGQPAEIQRPPKPKKHIEITTKELDAMLPNIPVEEVLHQLTADLPQTDEEVVPAETLILPTPEELVTSFSEPVSLDTDESEARDIEAWAPSSLLTADSNLSDEELDDMFGGEF